MSKSIDLTGEKFNRLTVIKRAGSDRRKNALWLCQCDCGKQTIVNTYCLKNGNTKSCGCLNKETSSKNIKEFSTTHGESRSRLYRIWNSMRTRCGCENLPYYKNYGGRGISVCKEWDKYEKFRDWALQNGYSDKLSIDRIDVNGDYCPENCRWATIKQQSNNKRTNLYLEYQGEKRTVAEWSEKTGIRADTIRWRVVHGWSIERALTNLTAQADK